MANEKYGRILKATGSDKGREVIIGPIEWENDKVCKIVHIWYKPEYEVEHIDKPE